VVEDLEPSWHAPNRAQGFRTYFTQEGIRVVPRESTSISWRWGLSLVGYGNGEKTWDVPIANLGASGHRMAYHRGALEEFYVNTPEGLEQGFILPAPPAGSGAGGFLPELKRWTTPSRRASVSGKKSEPGDLVHMDLALWGDLSPRISEDGQAIDFVTPAGAPVLHYAQLKVTDAGGSVLPSWMEGFAGEGVRGIRLVVDAREAVYPITIDPLSTGWAWTGVGGQANVYYGDSVATAGDVNGDGYSDVIVGASYYDSGQTDEGRAYLYLGSASGTSSVPAWTRESDQAGAGFGYPVAAAGDVNGDGYGDVLVGANGFDGAHSDAGRVYLYLGSAAGLATTPAWMMDGDQDFAGFGVWAATAGDVNGDGYSDAVVAAWLYDNGETDEGRAYLYLGSASGLASTPAWTAEGNQVGARFGYPVTTAGDVNRDGYADVIVGAMFYDNNQADEGRAYLYLGSASGLASTPAWTAESDQVSAQFGRSVSTAGDVNGDGYADVVVGAHLYDNGQTNEGRAYLYRGTATGLELNPAWVSESNQADARYGVSVATCGDSNGDGYADVLVGAELYTNGATSEGRAYLYEGSSLGLASTPAWTAESDQAGAQFGQVVATAGDVNGDGYSDAIVGAPNFDNTQFDEGRAYLYLGSASGPSVNSGWIAGSTQSDAHFGFALAPAGDVNGDGYADVIVGCYFCDNGQTDEGRAFVYLGTAGGLSLTVGWAAESNAANANFGYSVATAGDVNGDGYSDVIVGAPAQYDISNPPGRAMVYFGSPSGPSSTPDFTYAGDPHDASVVATAGDMNGDGYSDFLVGSEGSVGPPPSNVSIFLGSSSLPAYRTTLSVSTWSGNFNSWLGTAGDVNGDGYSDIIVGSPRYSNGGPDPYQGAAYVFLGSASLQTLPLNWSIFGNQLKEYLGMTVSTAGDVNGDGYADVIVGAPGYTALLVNQGRVFVYLGSPSGLSPTPAWVAQGEQTGEVMGESVGTAGDVNGDGYSDVIVGSRGWNNGGSYLGRALIYFGAASGLALFPGWSAEGNQDLSDFGGIVKTAGDVNGDGYADVLVGAINYDNGPTQVDAGRAFLYSGNGGGLSVRPQQRRTDDSAPIAPLGRSDAPGSFRLAGLGRTPFGRSRVRLEWEVKPSGTLFNGLGTQRSVTPLDTGTAGASLSELALGLNGAYHWRVRLLYDTAKTPLAQRSRWFTVPWNGWQEADLKVMGAAVGGFAWDDLDGDGVREGGEPGHAGVLVDLYSGGSNIVAQTSTLPDGSYHINVPGQGPYLLVFTSPAGTTYTVPEQGGDDFLDSDVSQYGLTGDIGPAFTTADASRWSAGLIACPGPTLPLFITGARFAPGTSDVILDFTDPNQPGTTTGATGYNSYRSTQPQPPPPPWMGLAGDTQDEDPGTPNIQLRDWTGDNLPVGSVFYYQVQAYNHICGTEGPR